MPSDWGPLRLADEDRCPQVYGSYDAGDEDIAHILVAQHLPYDPAREPIESVSLVLHDDSVLTAIAWIDREPRDTVNLKRGPAFQCADGWLEPRFPQRLPSYALDTAESRKYLFGRNYARIATTRDGALVVRIDHHTFHVLNLWAPGGTTLPDPLTWRTKRVWHRAIVVKPQTHHARPPQRPLSALDERLMREEARLDGTDGTMIERRP